MKTDPICGMCDYQSSCIVMDITECSIYQSRSIILLDKEIYDRISYGMQLSRDLSEFRINRSDIHKQLIDLLDKVIILLKQGSLAYSSDEIQGSDLCNFLESILGQIWSIVNDTLGIKYFEFEEQLIRAKIEALKTEEEYNIKELENLL